VDLIFLLPSLEKKGEISFCQMGSLPAGETGLIRKLAHVLHTQFLCGLRLADLIPQSIKGGHLEQSSRSCLPRRLQVKKGEALLSPKKYYPSVTFPNICLSAIKAYF